MFGVHWRGQQSTYSRLSLGHRMNKPNNEQTQTRITEHVTQLPNVCVVEQGQALQRLPVHQEQPQTNTARRNLVLQR